MHTHLVITYDYIYLPTEFHISSAFINTYSDHHIARKTSICSSLLLTFFLTFVRHEWQGLTGDVRLRATLDPQALAVVGSLHPELRPVGDESDGTDGKAQDQLSNPEKVGQVLPFERSPTRIHIAGRHICVHNTQGSKPRRIGYGIWPKWSLNNNTYIKYIPCMHAARYTYC